MKRILLGARGPWRRAIVRTIASFILLLGAVSAQALSRDEAQVWNLEQSYWKYVKSNDLDSYRALWHDNFLGWPSVSPTPVRKDHITDWITANTSRGRKLQSYSIEKLAIQVTREIAVDHYRVTTTWGNDEKNRTRPSTVRITHTWLRTNGTWQIIGGMSAPVNAEGK